MTIQEAKKLIRKAHFSADKPLDSLDLAVEQIYAELFGITEQMETKLKAKDERIAELKEGAKNTAEIYAKQLAARDKKITELEVKLDRFYGLKAKDERT